MRLTTTRWGLEPAELVTTAVAVVVSSWAFVTYGSPYLARGVVGDSIGFTVLLVPLVLRGRRARHEALVCLAGIGLVVGLGWRWPLRVGDAIWWTVFAVDLVTYVALRWALVSRDASRAARSGPQDARTAETEERP